MKKTAERVHMLVIIIIIIIIISVYISVYNNKCVVQSSTRRGLGVWFVVKYIIYSLFL